jgi:putative NADPH-quinone reductase
MARRIVVIQGHPDRLVAHYGHALADTYAEAAMAAGHEVRRIEVAELDLPLLRSKADWDGPLPPGLRKVQADIGWANHLVLFFPLWLGTMPAMLKAFLEQVLRPGFAFKNAGGGEDRWKPALRGKSARVVVTMGMPALWYRWYFRSHGVKGLERNILKFCGVSPVRETFIGMVETNENRRFRWLEKLRILGQAGK